MTEAVKIGGRPEPLVELTSRVVNSLPFTWRSLSLYIRHLIAGSAITSLGIHADNDPSMRVLIEGHGSKWVFDQDEWIEKYPEGLGLNPGDAVTLNNYCSSGDQLRHGVKILAEQPLRTSYLFNSYE